MKIEIDIHEPGDIKGLISLKNDKYDVRETKLECGDYVFDGELAFERKTYTDLWSSFLSGRLFDQIKRMSEEYKYCALIVEKSYVPYRVKKHYSRMFHMLNSLSFVLPVIRTGGKEETVSEMIRLYEKLQEGELATFRSEIIVGREGDEIEGFLCGIPGVGIGAAKVIRKKFKDLQGFIENVEGVKSLKVGQGKLGKRAEKIIKFVRKKW